MIRFIFVTGGVLSSLGKGLASAALGSLLQARGFKVRIRKFDPYINVDPGTMNPAQHGEVYVTNDGAETDLDLGHYERFTGVDGRFSDSITTGKVYSDVIARERRGDYLGATVQVIPHITDRIKEFLQDDLDDDLDFLICEIGGTVGDIEGLPYLEAFRQFSVENGDEKSMFIHLTLVPYIASAGELKTKPTQHSVKELLHLGIQPDLLLCRCDREIPESAKKKLALFCNIKPERVIEARDVENIYEVPISYSQHGLDIQVLKFFGLASDGKPDLSKWTTILQSIEHSKQQVNIAVVGKYMETQDAYKSVYEALIHGGLVGAIKVNIHRISAEDLESKTKEQIASILANMDGILLPGGYGVRGTVGKMAAIQYCRENKIPCFGICYGMQLAMVEFARNVLGLKQANSTEIDPNTTDPVVGLITEWEKDGKIEKRTHTDDLGGTMRLGAYPCQIKQGSLIHSIYQTDNIQERHRHRYEVNIGYKDQFEKAGLLFTGMSPDGKLPEIVELKDHPWFIGVQFHPELKSRPFAPSPLFTAFIEAAVKGSNTK